jgi:hypothetical protein
MILARRLCPLSQHARSPLVGDIMRCQESMHLTHRVKMPASKSRDRTEPCYSEAVSKRKKKPDTEPIPNPLKVDEQEFTDVIRKMVNTSPITRKEVEHRRVRKNPGTDPRYLPVFDFSRTIRISHEERDHIVKTDRLNRERKH